MNSRVGVRQSGFTLVEIAIVLVILFLLTGHPCHVIGTRNIDHGRQTELDVQWLANAVNAYVAEHGQRPDALANLHHRHDDGTHAAEALSLDPWGQAYVLRAIDADAWEVASLGPDGVPSGDDITRPVERTRPHRERATNG